jgi:hypothetical protein
MMFRIEIKRRIDCKQGKGRNHVNPNFVIYEPTLQDAYNTIVRLRNAGEEVVTPDYFPLSMLEARLRDHATIFADWVQNGEGDQEEIINLKERYFSWRQKLNKHDLI